MTDSKCSINVVFQLNRWHGYTTLLGKEKIHLTESLKDLMKDLGQKKIIMYIYDYSNKCNICYDLHFRIEYKDMLKNCCLIN